MGKNEKEAYILPGGVIIDAKDNLHFLLKNHPGIVANHKRQACPLCSADPDAVRNYSYDDLLVHWKLMGIALEACFVCKRDYPQDEYITCGLAAICRHCQAISAASKHTEPGADQRGNT